MADVSARMLRLLSLLQSRPDWTGPELAEELGVTARTIRNDVTRLRRLGYPVEAAPGISGGYRLGAGADLPPLLLDDDEAVAVAVGLRMAACTSLVGTEETSLRALDKLGQVLPSRLRRRVNALQTHVEPMHWGPPQPAVDPETLALLSQACRDREQVRFDYADREGTETRRLVEPYRLVPDGRRWYLVAWDLRRDDWRTFRIDRTVRPRLAGVRFAARELPAPDAATYVKESIARSRPAPSCEADVVVHAPAAEVAARTHRPLESIEVVDDGRCRVRLVAESIDWLALRVAMLGLDFEVTAPPELVGELRDLSARLERGVTPDGLGRGTRVARR
jgi:predicted DNA-binding transcriptional regulator YafY